MDKTVLLDHFLDHTEHKHVNIEIRYDADGINVQAACLRTIWRYMVFQGKTGGKKVNLYHEQQGSPGQLIHKYSKLILRRPTVTSELPDRL